MLPGEMQSLSGAIIFNEKLSWSSKLRFKKL